MEELLKSGLDILKLNVPLSRDIILSPDLGFWNANLVLLVCQYQCNANAMQMQI